MRLWPLYCQLCGKDFKGNNNVQKYCPDCAPRAYELKKQGKMDSIRIIKKVNCECCGRLFPKFAGKTICEQCEALNIYERRSVEYIEEVETPHEKIKNISEITREARERGMSYGQYQNYLREQRLSETTKKT